jgi:hypothetical protein
MRCAGETSHFSNNFTGAVAHDDQENKRITAQEDSMTSLILVAVMVWVSFLPDARVW